MPSDRDSLLAMGFDPARVDCAHSLSLPCTQLISTGALSATSNRGLQPAMDHIFEHEADPLPDPNAPQQSKPTPAAMDEDDPDLELLASADAEAKVCDSASLRRAPHFLVPEH